jgi:hypothetical protein
MSWETSESWWRGSGVNARDYLAEFDCPKSGCEGGSSHEYSSDSGPEAEFDDITCPQCHTLYNGRVNAEGETYCYEVEE